MARKKPLKIHATAIATQQFESGDTIDPAFVENGVPTGGTTDQVLAKIDATDYNTHWVTPSGGGGGGGVASVTGDAVDNTDPANPVVNAIPLDATGGGVTSYAGSSVWRTSVPPDDYYEGGVAWDKFMDKSTALFDNLPGAFCWYGGVDGGQRSFFQSKPDEGYFEFGGTQPGSAYARVQATPYVVRLDAVGASSASIIVNSSGAINFSATQYFDFGYGGAIIFPRIDESTRDALIPDVGWAIFNTTVGKLQVYDGSTWQSAW